MSQAASGTDSVEEARGKEQRETEGALSRNQATTGLPDEAGGAKAQSVPLATASSHGTVLVNKDCRLPSLPIRRLLRGVLAGTDGGGMLLPGTRWKVRTSGYQLLRSAL